MKALLIAGTASGVGKTTVVMGLIRALRRRGMRVQPFKVGPDFIDPGFHALASGYPSPNLDGWMLSRERVQETFRRYMLDADIGIVEGVMGLFDGFDGRCESGSTAEIAKWLGITVILVVDARAMARSGAAVVFGFERFDPDLPVGGIIFNRVGSRRHFESLREAVERNCRAPVLGYLDRNEALHLPERHLGLVTSGEHTPSGDWERALDEGVESGICIDRLLSVSKPARPINRQSAHGGWEGGAIAVPPERPLRLAIARDQAFSFYYRENLDLLSRTGIQLCEFSPLRDSSIPANADGIYLGGGYPELYADRLSANEALRNQIRLLAEEGLPIYAECGGLMYLTRAIHDLQGREHPMTGIFPVEARMLPRRKALGYVEVRIRRDCLLGGDGTVLRGHEYHYSELVGSPLGDGIDTAYELKGRRDEGPRPEGYCRRAVLASYVHLHFGSNPRAAESFARALLAHREAFERSSK